MKSSHNRRNSLSTSSRLLCAVLCAVTWRGPLPCLHDHVAGPQVISVGTALADHCERFHAEVQRETCLGWHVHVLLPWATPEPQENGEQAPVDPLVKCEVLLTDSAVPTVCGGLFTELWGDATLVPCDSIRPALLDDAQVANSFLNSLLQSVPLCAVTGVALC